VRQRFGLPILLLVPLLALAGVFGEALTQRTDRRGPLLVGASVPVRFRYRQRMTLHVSVANRSSGIVNDVRVRIDSTYLDHFSGVSLSPHASADGAVAFGSIAPNESALLTVTLEGERAGTVRGSARVTDAAGDTVRVPLTSTVFP
jgi:hypothetical protein